jgi:hypothetical protein
MFVLTLPLITLAFVTTLVARSLFPSETDHRVLTVLPVTRALIFRAKGAAVTFFVGLFALTATVSFTPPFALASSGGDTTSGPLLRVLALIVAPAASACFGALAVVSIVGLVTVCAPRGTQTATGLTDRSAAHLGAGCAVVRLLQAQSYSVRRTDALRPSPRGSPGWDRS